MEINVEREKLLAILKKNKAIHDKEYLQLLDAFYNNVATVAHSIAEQAERCDASLSLRIDVIRPVSNSKDYENTIGMLELSSDAMFKLSEKDYKKYVLDEWDWSSAHAFTKSSYGIK